MKDLHFYDTNTILARLKHKIVNKYINSENIKMNSCFIISIYFYCFFSFIKNRNGKKCGISNRKSCIKILFYFRKVYDRSNRLSFETVKQICKYYFRKAFKLIIDSASQTFINTHKNSQAQCLKINFTPLSKISYNMLSRF